LDLQAFDIGLARFYTRANTNASAIRRLSIGAGCLF
jgi:hypothetical protein